MKKTPSAHAPALAPQEAALLPALPRNLLMPGPELDFRPAEELADVQVQRQRVRRSAAGRAILHARGVSMPGVTPMARDM